MPPINPLELFVLILRIVIVAAGLGILLTKSAARPRLVTLLLILCTIFVGVVFSSNAAGRAKEGKGAAVMEAGQSEFMMRMASGFKAFSSGMPLASGRSTEEVFKSAEKAMDSAVEHDPQSLALRFKQIVLAVETGTAFTAELEAMRSYKDERAAHAADLIDSIYVKKSLVADPATQIEFIDKLLAPGFYRDLVKLELYRAAGQTKVFEQAAADYNDGNKLFAARLVGLMFVVGSSVLIGLVVLCVQLFNLSRKQEDNLSDIRAPQPYGFTKVYGVFVGWLTLESFLSPAVTFLIPYLKGGVKEPAVLALLTMAIYLITNLPALVLAWLIAVKPTGVNFFEAVKLRWKTPTLGPVKLVLIGIMTWFACVPLVLVSSIVARQLFKSEGSSNPILTVIMEAVRSHNALAAILFVIAVGVLPALCEETLFRGFLYTSLRWRFGAFPSMLISALLFSSVHMDPGAFVPLFVLGFVFAFVFERTRSLIPSMIAHCMWNTGTFILMLSIFG